MVFLKSAHCLTCGALLLVMISGCQVVYGYRPVVVLARDAETQKPIAGAEIQVSYLDNASMLSPAPAWASTASNGIARVDVAPSGELGAVLEAKARGYLVANKNLSTETVRAMEAPHLLEDVKRRPVNVVVEMFAEPYPTIDLVVPAGFRGIVQAEVRDGVGPPWTPGQRCVAFSVPASGKVQVAGPTWLPHHLVPEFRVRFADGIPITARAQRAELGFWWLRCEGTTHFFLVGTAHDFEDYRLFSHTDPAPSGKSSGSGQGGRGGRRGRRSSEPSADSSGM